MLGPMNELSSWSSRARDAAWEMFLISQRCLIFKFAVHLYSIYWYMSFFIYNYTTDSRLLRMRRPTVGPSRRLPHVDSVMGYTISSRPPLSSPVLSHYQTESLSRITGCEGIFKRSFVISEVVRSTPIDGKGSDRIGPSSRIRSSTPTTLLAHMSLQIDW